MQHNCRVLALFGKAVQGFGIQKRGGEKHRGLPISSRVSEGQCSKTKGKTYRCHSGDLQQRWRVYALHAEKGIDYSRL